MYFPIESSILKDDIEFTKQYLLDKEFLFIKGFFGITKEDALSKYGFEYSFEERGDTIVCKLFTKYKSSPEFVNGVTAKISKNNLLPMESRVDIEVFRKQIKEYILNKEEGVLEEVT